MTEKLLNGSPPSLEPSTDVFPEFSEAMLYTEMSFFLSGLGHMKANLPCTVEGEPDMTRPPHFTGHVSLNVSTPNGDAVLPLTFPIAANSIPEACLAFREAARGALDGYQKRAFERAFLEQGKH